ncbi:hypothetical protein NC652_013466 [Populus alba x Populus x berolinensis]|nr:hypothetical protein NC652_013466 [Populus alba x Populus x berolinensis]
MSNNTIFRFGSPFSFFDSHSDLLIPISSYLFMFIKQYMEGLT